MNKTKKKEKNLGKRVWQHRELYVMLIPMLVFLIIFWVIPLYGIQIAFRDFSYAGGFFHSKFVGWKHFIRFFNSFYFERTLWNTAGINLYSLLVSFPLGIILAIMFNELRNKKFKEISQIISYAPNFLSVVVIGGMILAFLSPSTGCVNAIVQFFGGQPIDFMSNPKYFWHIYVWTGVWQGLGFGTIMYIAAMSSISPELYDAADIDGATRIQRIWYVTLPGIQEIIIVLLILSLGNLFSLGFEKILLLQNNLNLEASEVISTYVYKVGLMQGKYSYTTAISLFNTAINLVILTAANKICKKVRGIGLW